MVNEYITTTQTTPGEVVFNCPHCNMKLEMELDFGGTYWNCISHGKVYGFFINKFYEVVND